MNNYDYPWGADNSSAPWNEPDGLHDNYCPECDTEMDYWDSGKKWTDYKCPECGYTTSNEPCYDE